MALELKDIQGNILRGYGFAHAIYLFFEVPDVASGRRFLGELVDSLQDADLWTSENRPNTVTNLAVTYAGLQALGVPAAILDELPPSFCQPIRKRAAQLLDDTGPSDPEHWVEGLGTERSHILVTVNGREGYEAAFAAEVTRVRQRADGHGLTVIHDQPAAAIPNRREHFGWADGFGQPGVEGAPATPGKPSSKPGDGFPLPGGGWRDLKAGEFILGEPDEDGQVVSGRSAALLKNGTYMVYRKLYQNVAKFRLQLQADAMKYGRTLPDDPPLDDQQLYELMAAKVVGRWRDGKSILEEQRRTDEESRGLGNEALEEPSNDFRYWEDKDGFKCPLGAHIRRTNPRDALGWEGDGRMAVRHRIIRRGMPYGDFLPLGEGDGLKDDEKDRGLIFVCFNASLDRQFEIVQRQWCNDGNAFTLGNDKDYLLGDPTWAPPDTSGSPRIPLPDGRLSTCRVSIEGDPPHYVQGQAPVVLTRGCEYLLMPGLAALRGLANGEWMAPERVAPPGEDEAIGKVVAAATSKFERENPPGVRPARRDQHAKAHGTVRAEFVVAADVPPNLRHGILRRPGTYPAWVRFSSSASIPQPDSKPDAHGMAIKVMDVEGAKVLESEGDATTQDFILANSKVFFCRNARDYVALATLASEGRILRFFLGWNPAKWRPRELVNLLVATRKKVYNPLQIRYWSQTPYALGHHVVKYSATPRSAAKDDGPASEGDDHLEEAMKRQLASSEAVFDFMVQVQTDPLKMPVEDPTIEWKERRSPFRRVATIRIPAQDFTSAAQKSFGENLTFTPWHALREHEPLGGINRVRRMVYEDISDLRHEKNGVPQHEPSGDEMP